MPRWVEKAPRVMRWGFVETSARVRWGECDVQGHAYYGSYIPWCDLGRESFALAVGVDYWNYKITTGEFHIRFHTPAQVPGRPDHPDLGGHPHGPTGLLLRDLPQGRKPARRRGALRTPAGGRQGV